MAKVQKSDFFELAKKAATSPQESLAEITHKEKQLFIGVPNETHYQENRVGLTPEAVHLLVSNGHKVMVEAEAGLGAKFSDNDYSEAGAEITYERKELFKKAEVLMKVAFPLLEEIRMMGYNQTLISALHLPLLTEKQIRLLLQKKVTAVSFEYLKDDYQLYPVIQSMSEIAGSAAVLIAGEYMNNVLHGKGVMLGGITGVPPAEVVILGGGTVGQTAAKAALGLGAEVKVFDNSLFKLRRLHNFLPSQVYNSIIHPNILAKALRRADVAIGAIRAKGGRTPCVVTEEMVTNMKNGSVIVDVSIDQGGCFETSSVTTHTDPVFEKHGVIHYCVPNIPSRVARTASYALSNIFAPLLVELGSYGGIQDYLWSKIGVRYGTYIYKGNLTNKFLGEKFRIPHKEIDLLIAAHI